MPAPKASDDWLTVKAQTTWSGSMETDAPSHSPRQGAAAAFRRLPPIQNFDLNPSCATSCLSIGMTNATRSLPDPSSRPNSHPVAQSPRNRYRDISRQLPGVMPLVGSGATSHSGTEGHHPPPTQGLPRQPQAPYALALPGTVCTSVAKPMPKPPSTTGTFSPSQVTSQHRSGDMRLQQHGSIYRSVPGQHTAGGSLPLKQGECESFVVCSRDPYSGKLDDGLSRERSEGSNQPYERIQWMEPVIGYVETPAVSPAVHGIAFISWVPQDFVYGGHIYPLTAYTTCHQIYNGKFNPTTRLVYSIACKKEGQTTQFLRVYYVPHEDEKVGHADSEEEEEKKRNERFDRLLTTTLCNDLFPDLVGVVQPEQRQDCCHRIARALSGLAVAGFDER